MTNPCPQNPLCELAETKFDESEKRWIIKFEALEMAIDKAEKMLTVRLEEMNNFRKQIEHERQDFTTRRETILINFVISILVVLIGAFITHAIIK